MPKKSRARAPEPALARTEPSVGADGPGESPGPVRRPVTPPTSWAARYGEAILRDGVAAIPWALYAYQGLLGLAAPEVWFVSVVLARKWDAELPHPSLRQITDQTGVSLRQVQYLRAVLTHKELLTVRPRQSTNGGQASNEYDFSGLFTHLEAAILAQAAPANAIRADDASPAAAADPADNSFVARFGRVLAGAGIIAVPAGLYTRQRALGLSPQECWFITYILAHRWTADLPYPSLRKMAERTGYSVRQLHQIKEALVTGDHLRLVARYSADGGQAANGYDFSPLLGQLTALLRTEEAPAAPPPVPQMAIVSRRGRRRADSAGMPNTALGDGQGTAGEGVQRTTPGGMQRTAGEGAQRPAGEGTQSPAPHPLPIVAREGRQMALSWETNAENHTGGDAKNHTGRRAESRSGTDASCFPGDAAENSTAPGAETRAQPDAESFPRRRADHVEVDHVEANRVNDSNREVWVHTTTEPAANLPYSPYIAATVLDYSRELGDGIHGPANVNQTLRLWQESRRGETAFVTVLQEARQRLRLYQGKQGPGRITNKMAYFFRIVEDLLAPGPDAPAPPPSAERRR